MKRIHNIVVFGELVGFVSDKNLTGKKTYSRTSATVGMFECRDEALHAVKTDRADISEDGSNPFVVVEEVSLNTVNCNACERKQTWFEWNKNLCAYVKIEEAPDDLKTIANYSIC